MSMTIQSSQISNAILSLEVKDHKSAEEIQLLQQLQGIDLTTDSVTLTDSLHKSLQSWSESGASFLPLPQGNLDIKGAINALNTMENMMLLLSHLSREMRQARFLEAKGLLEAKIVDLKASADLKIEGAAELRSSAQEALIIGCVAGVLGIMGGIAGGCFIGKGFETLGDSLSKLSPMVTETINSGAKYVTAQGQADNQEITALSDEKQAESTAKENLAKEQQQLEDAAKSLLNKMTELLQSIADIKQKGAEAAAKA